MKINGLQKLTLLDFPGRTACTVFLAGCDFACPFCHNFDLTSASAPAVMEDDELLRFLETRKGLIEGVAFTGGEPTLRPGLAGLFRDVRALGFQIKLDTNGNSPDALEAILAEGLADYVAMDIKNSPDAYAATAGLKRVDIGRINRSIDLLMGGKTDYEFRTTVIDSLHSEASFSAIGEWIDGAKQYFLQPFKDGPGVPFSGFEAPSAQKLNLYAEILRPHVGKIGIRGLD
ncbi:MAG TPA: anaerobic ribonucleoside-triphosphate reductase activating protein [Bacillota bacterium]|nr:anaerobic ribonucleoside-triphosphate reductase activating protein [Bacillota bacterium]HQC36171.1 anaerobic ribonucleoside-triphosphate reductase activating protein [Bacillota bacterium]